MSVVKESKEVVERACELLKSGQMVAVMTETVYGMAVDATNKKAIERVYKLKKRPNNNPLIVHVSSLKMAKEFVNFNKDLDLLAQTFWPGPLTMILQLKKNTDICKTVTSGLNSVALRVPKSKIFLEIIKKFNKPIAAPSANISGYVSSTDALHVKDSFGKSIKLIIDSGRSKFGLESTVINLTSKPYLIERMGIVDEKEILKKTKIIVLHKDMTNYNTIVSPGQIKKHYSPNTPLRLNADYPLTDEAFLAFGYVKLKPSKFYLNLSNNSNLEEAAYNLFDFLRKLDKVKKKTIAVSPIPMIGIGKTINERLIRASNYE